MANGTALPVNRNLDELHAKLIAANELLSNSLDTITDPDLAHAVVTEMREVVHRIDLVQSLLFTAASDKISVAVAKVRDANNALTTSLGQITDKISLVKNLTSFLALVDKVIDLAKVL
jgi:hypothetical protein